MVIVDTVYLNEGEIVIKESVFDYLIKKEKELKELLRLSEFHLDNHNADYGNKFKYCLVCSSNSYDTIVGVLHYPYCTIRRIREVLKEE